MNLKELSLEYFLKFTNKDIQHLKTMFTDDIQLVDWDNNSKGIDEVLKINQSIFDSVDYIMVNPLNIAYIHDTVFAELIVTIGKDNLITTLNVVDILRFRENKICQIKAYKR